MLTRGPLAQLDRRALVEGVLAAKVRPGQGGFIDASRNRLAAVGLDIAFEERLGP